MSFIYACLAFVIYGAWAVYANSEYGSEVMLRSGVGQGLYAFASTFFVTASAIYVLQTVGANIKGLLSAFSSSFVLMLVFPLSIHYALQTPDVLQTILPGLIWGSLYILFILKVSYKKVSIGQ